MKRTALAFALTALAFTYVTAACSSDDEEKTDTAAKVDASVGPSPVADGAARDPDNCVKPGTKNNDQGIGGYCETHTDCVKGLSFCTALLGAPAHAWFCSRPCAEDPNCGEGLYCASDPRGVACVPIICGVADAGAETSVAADAADAG